MHQRGSLTRAGPPRVGTDRAKAVPVVAEALLTQPSRGGGGGAAGGMALLDAGAEGAGISGEGRGQHRVGGISG